MISKCSHYVAIKDDCCNQSVTMLTQCVCYVNSVEDNLFEIHIFEVINFSFIDLQVMLVKVVKLVFLKYTCMNMVNEL